MKGKKAALALGVEIGGSKLQVVLGRTDGTILHTTRGSVAPEQGASGILAWIEGALEETLGAPVQEHGKPCVVGVGFGGPVESATGRVLTSHQISGWQDVRLREWFEDRVCLPAVVANDSSASGWAEYCLGAGVGTHNFCYMNIGSGIGGALVIDGKLHDGQGFGAGEIGHTYVPDWTAETVGEADKLENLCSGWSIERRLREGDTASAQTCAELGEAARAGDGSACDEIERIARSVGLALANVIALVHPERIAMGGGVSLLGDVLLDPVREQVDRLVFGPFRGEYTIVPCELGESVVLAGALLLAGKLVA